MSVTESSSRTGVRGRIFLSRSLDILSYFKIPFLLLLFLTVRICIQSSPVTTVLFGMHKYGIIGLKTSLLITVVELLYFSHLRNMTQPAKST